MSVRRMSNGMWRADWRMASGRRVRRQFRTRVAAERALRDALDARDRGEPVEQAGIPAPTLREFWDAEQDRFSEGRDEVTFENYSRSLRLHVLPVLGSLRLDEITGPVLQRWIDGMRAGAATQNRSFSALSVVMTRGAKLGYCQRISKKDVDLPPEVPKEYPVPKIDEAMRIVDVVDPRFRAMILLASFTGMRQSECFGLRPESVDLEAGVVFVQDKLTRKKQHLSKMKTKKSRRVVEIPTIVVEALAEHMESHPNDEYVFHLEGRPVTATWFRKYVWLPALEQAGLPGFIFHSLRSTGVGVMEHVYGWKDRDVVKAVGHTNARMTFGRYGRYEAPVDSEARDRLDTAVREALRGAVGHSEGTSHSDVVGARGGDASLGATSSRGSSTAEHLPCNHAVPIQQGSGNNPDRSTLSGMVEPPADFSLVEVLTDASDARGQNMGTGVAVVENDQEAR